MNTLAVQIVDALFTDIRDIDASSRFHHFTPEQRNELERDCRWIKDRYQQLKSEGVDFMTAAFQARSEFVELLLARHFSPITHH
jgi:hypothetical protein